MNQHHCHCTNHRTPTMGRYECVAFVRGNVAYALDALPATHVEAITGTPWGQATIHLCGTHHTQFINRKPININNVQEDTIMSTTYTTNHMFPMFSLDALIARAADMWADQAEYVRDIHDEVDMDMGYPVWFNRYTARIDRLNKVIDNRQFIEFWMNNPIFPNVPKEDTMNINEIITNNALKENNVPNSPVPGSSDRGDKWIKCVKCSKEVGIWYHANAADVRTCMGAAPAPVKRVYKTDVLTGETVLTNSDLRFFYDSSQAVVFAKAKELREAGVHVFKVARATKGNKDWYVEYKV